MTEVRKGDRVRFTETYAGGTVVTTEGVVNEVRDQRVTFGADGRRDVHRYLDHGDVVEVLERAKPELEPGQRYRSKYGEVFLITGDRDDGPLLPVDLSDGYRYSPDGALMHNIRGGKYELIVDGS